MKFDEAHRCMTPWESNQRQRQKKLPFFLLRMAFYDLVRSVASLPLLDSTAGFPPLYSHLVSDPPHHRDRPPRLYLSCASAGGILEWMLHLSRFTSVMRGAQCSMAGFTVGGCACVHVCV